jgi:hypothetical protein
MFAVDWPFRQACFSRQARRDHQPSTLREFVEAASRVIVIRASAGMLAVFRDFPLFSAAAEDPQSRRGRSPRDAFGHLAAREKSASAPANTPRAVAWQFRQSRSTCLTTQALPVNPSQLESTNHHRFRRLRR